MHGTRLPYCAPAQQHSRLQKVLGPVTRKGCPWERVRLQSASPGKVSDQEFRLYYGLNPFHFWTIREPKNRSVELCKSHKRSTPESTLLREMCLQLRKIYTLQNYRCCLCSCLPLPVYSGWCLHWRSSGTCRFTLDVCLPIYRPPSPSSSLLPRLIKLATGHTWVRTTIYSQPSIPPNFVFLGRSMLILAADLMPRFPLCHSNVDGLTFFCASSQVHGHHQNQG